MPTLHLLGTGAAVTDPHRTTTMLAFSDVRSTLVVDCGGDVIQRLLAAGFPLFMEKIWLSGRTDPIPVFGISRALDQARRCFETFDTSNWDLPEIRWTEVAHEEGALLLDDASWRVTVTPVAHPVPTIGIRVESVESGGSVAYSCDTEPTEEVVRLARNADILVHEANGEFPGHTSAAQAADIAARAGARRLLLVHLPPALDDASLEPARQVFANVAVGDELGAYAF
jgi:ribonuclease Z